MPGARRPRGRDLLCDRGNGYRLRLLASRPRRRYGRYDRQGPALAEKAKTLIRSVVPLLAVQTEPCCQGCQRALDQALITAPERRDPELLARLDAVAGRALGLLGPGEGR